MLDIKFIRNNKEKAKEGIKNKNANVDIDAFLALDEKRRMVTQKVEEARARQNRISGEIAKGKDEKLIAESKELKKEVAFHGAELEKLNEAFKKTLLAIPNIPLDTVPVGKDDSQNVEIKKFLEPTTFGFKEKDYMAIASELDLIDVERAGKVSGSRFGYIKRQAAMLEFALIQYALQILTSEKEIAEIIKKEKLKIKSVPFVPVVPPVLVKPEMMEGMGYTERGKDEIYFLEKDNMYLVGTSEQSIGPMHSGEIFDEEELPLRYVGFSTCFRREAGSYGKDTKGILRVHQFDKLEMFVLCNVETSLDEHKLLLACEEKMMQDLQLPYRILNICTGDLGDPAAAKYDIEAWMPSEGKYRETHSTSNTTDYQSRHLNIRYRTEIDGKKANEFVHMLNGTCFAIGRMLIAIIENYQQKDGSIEVPKALQKYTGFEEIRK